VASKIMGSLGEAPRGVTDGGESGHPFPVRSAPLPRDGWQAARELRSSVDPSVIIARPAATASCCPYAFGSTHTPVWVLLVYNVCTVLRAKAAFNSNRSSLSCSVSHHRLMSHSNASCRGGWLRVPNSPPVSARIIASYLPGPQDGNISR